MTASASTVFPQPDVSAPGAAGPTPGQVRIWNAATNAFEFSGNQSFPLGPTGSIRENFPRAIATLADSAVFASGTVLVSLFPLVGGDLVTKLSVVVGATAGASLTHQWMALCDANLNVLAVSADGTSGAIPASAELQFTMGSPFQVVTSGAYYAAILVTQTSAQPSLMSKVDGTSTVAGLAPKLCGTAGAATTPPLVGAQINSGTITAGLSRFWSRAL